ncbi:MAG: mechanosensitive ion channel family protein [Muribaculaceae bacterium]|nr:mechanosensitive ion channel family protein [Muribaculaceae bacterium]
MQLLNLIPTHKVAIWLVEHIDRLLDRCGLAHYPTLEQAVYLVIVVFIALGVGLAVRHAVVWVVRKIVRLRDGELGRQLLQQRVIQKCSHFIPPFVFMGMVPFAFDSQSPLMHAVDKVVLIYAIVTIAYGLAAVLRFVFQQVNSRRNTRNLPVQGVLNVVLGIMWIVVAIVCVSVIVDKSPGTLLAGLTAFAAALMLIFKDSILGFVAGIQMSENDMLHVGDWISVPGTVANGNVVDVSLSTVKIRNFDNTLVMVPPYELVSKGFQNYRAMQDTGARRIMVNITVGTDCVQPLAADRIAALAGKYPALQEFADRAAKTPDGWICDNGNYVVNGTTETNLGLFRAYTTAYLKASPHMSKDQMIMVRQCPPTPNGYVLQIYCFTDTSAWVAYEGIQSALLEHLTMAMRDFGLEMYSASDLDVDLSGK